jgi:hypothetical protein
MAIRLTGLAGFLAALLLSPAGHRHLAGAFRAIGYFSLIWAPMMDRYIERRKTPKPLPPVPNLADAAPLHSDHWGRTTVSSPNSQVAT